MTARACLDCPATISPRNQGGRCRPCTARFANANPATNAKRAASLKLYRANLTKDSAHMVNMRAAFRTPEARARRSELGKQRQPKWREASLSPEVRARAGRSISKAKLAHIPLPYREQYMHLTAVKRISAKDAERMIREQIASNEAHYLRTGEIKGVS